MKIVITTPYVTLSLDSKSEMHLQYDSHIGKAHKVLDYVADTALRFERDMPASDVGVAPAMRVLTRHDR